MEPGGFGRPVAVLTLLGVLLIGLATLACNSHGSAEGAPIHESSGDSTAQQPAIALGPLLKRAPARPLAPGDNAPDFVALAHTGARVKLSQFFRKPVLIIFYDRDGSEQSTALFQALSDDWLFLQAALGIVLALSPESAVEHAAFASEAKWPFLLLSDPERRIARSFGLSTDPRALSAFVVAPDGRIQVARDSVTAAWAPELRQALARR